jgi:isoleucyl-tRNA synthetase
VELATGLAAHGTFEITVNARAAAPRLGKDVQRVFKAVKAGQ